MTERDIQRDKLLLAALPHIAFDGWTRSALEAGARDAGLTPADVLRFFPGGAREAVAALSAWADRKMIEALEGSDLSERRIREKIALAVRLRLAGLAPYREAVRRSIAYLALGPNVPTGIRLLYNTVDAMWYAIGDRSADFSFYTKRALLAGVVSATTLYWLDDETEDFSDTAGFLDRRIEDVMRIPRLRGRLEEFARKLPDPLRALRTARTRRPRSSG